MGNILLKGYRLSTSIHAHTECFFNVDFYSEIKMVKTNRIYLTIPPPLLQRGDC